jgi:predicted transcriptional regulator YheO
MSSFTPYTHFADLVTRLFNPHVEAVIHDLQSKKIAAIYNSFSLRTVGDFSLLDGDESYEGLTIIGPYEKRNHDGTLLRSITLVIKDEQGRATGLLCLNFNLACFEQLERLARSFLISEHTQTLPRATLFQNDWREHIHQTLSTFLLNHYLTSTTMTKEHKRSFVRQLEEMGVFEARGSLPYVAKILRISRPTLYTYLKHKDIP